MPEKAPSPPRFYTKLFKWFCRDEYYLELQGDLEEEFYDNAEEFGSSKAARLYRKEIIRMIRPSVLKRTFINTFMRRSLFSHFIKISSRNLRRNLSYTVLNLVGFAAALAVCLFCVNAIYSNLELDKKFSDRDLIYRVNLERSGLSGPSLTATTQIALHQKVKDAIPEADKLGFIQTTLMGNQAFVKGSNRNFSGHSINKDFLDIFDYEMILGNKEDIFRNLKNIIITEEIMNQYFTPENVIGAKFGPYIISGVIENPSKVSHLDFEFLSGDYQDHTAVNFFSSWEIYSMQQLYLKLLPTTDPDRINEKLATLSASINSELANQKDSVYYNYVLEPLADVAQSRASFNNGELLNSDGQKMVMTLIFMVLLIATFNYTNLAMASAINRTKEVAIRKVLGTKKYALTYQFLIETVILSLLGFIFGLLIFKLLAPTVASFTGFAFQESLSPKRIATFFIFALGAGIFAGLIPGIFFSRLSILTLFRKSTSKNQFTIGLIKRGIMVIQVTVSLLVFTMGFLLLSQSQLITSQSTPFSGENRVVVDLPPTDSLNVVFRNELRRINGVESVAGLSGVPFLTPSPTYGIRKHHLRDTDWFSTAAILHADTGFLSTFDQSINWIVNKDEAIDKPYLLVNEAFTQEMGDDEKRFDQATYSLGQEYYPVFGVVKNLNLTSPYEEVTPAAVLVDSRYLFRTYAIEVSPNRLKPVLSEVGELYTSLFPKYDFFPVFFDDVLRNSLRQFRSIINALIFVFSCIIAITLMGQIGMAMFQAKSKEKEIGIRKVLGASFQQIIRLLLRSTFIQLIIAGLIACPLAYIAFRDVTPDFSIPLSLNIYHFLGAFVVFAMLISTLVSSQTWKTIKQNPVDSLQNE